MLNCPNCGTDNPLGRVFCVNCGGKLDLEGMSSEEVAEKQMPSWFSRHWPKLVVLAVILLLIPVGLALWPRTARVGEEGKPRGGRRIVTDMSMIGRLSKGQKTTRKLNEADINGYFEYTVKKKLEDFTVSVDVHEGWCLVRAVRSFGKVDLKAFKWEPKVSYDLKCIPHSGMLIPKGVSIGHQGVFGPFKTMAVKAVHKRLSSLREWKYVSHITDIEMADDTISLSAKK